MPFEKYSGTDNSDANSTGFRTQTNSKQVWEDNYTDAIAPAAHQLLSGVTNGGVCTASGTTVTIPSGTKFFALQEWIADGAVGVVVPDNATTYLWGCCDGVIRQTASTSLPSSFTALTCCLLTKVVLSAGTPTIDNTVQWVARTIDTTNRIAIEAALKVGALYSTGLTKSVAGSADVTLTALETRNHYFEFTGTLTGSISVIIPFLADSSFTVFNNTSGAFTLTVKQSAGGSGIAVGQGKRAQLRAVSTNVVRLAADV